MPAQNDLERAGRELAAGRTPQPSGLPLPPDHVVAHRATDPALLPAVYAARATGHDDAPRGQRDGKQFAQPRLTLGWAIGDSDGRPMDQA